MCLLRDSANHRARRSLNWRFCSSTSLDDGVPLHWKDQYGFHVGVERRLLESTVLASASRMPTARSPARHLLRSPRRFSRTNSPPGSATLTAARASTFLTASGPILTRAPARAPGSPANTTTAAFMLARSLSQLATRTTSSPCAIPERAEANSSLPIFFCTRPRKSELC